MLYLVSQTWRSVHSLAGNLLTSKCALCLLWKNVLFSRAQGVCARVLPAKFRSLLLLSFGHRHSTENWSGAQEKGMPFITAFRTLDDIAVLSTTVLAYSKPTFSWFFKIITIGSSLDRRQCHCLCLVCLWWQLYFCFWTEYEWSWEESSSTIFSKDVSMDTKNTTRLQITVILIMSLQKYLLSLLQVVHILHKKKKKEPTTKTGWIACWDLTWAAVTRNF